MNHERKKIRKYFSCVDENLAKDILETKKN